MKNKKVLLTGFLLAVGLFSAGNSVLASCATVENDPGCLMVGQSCGANGEKKCQYETCNGGDSSVISCLANPAGETFTCEKTAGQSCKGDACSTLDGFESASGTCPVGQSCCKPTATNTCIRTGGNVCMDEVCESLDGFQSATGTCLNGQFCCKPSVSNTCIRTDGNVCMSEVCESLDGFQSATGACPNQQFCCKPKDVNTCIRAGNVCKGDVCETLDGGYQTASGMCSAGEFCCKPKNKENNAGPMWDVQELGGYGLPEGKIAGIIKNLVSWLLYIFGFLGIIAFVVSGIMYLTAGGDSEQEKKAKLAMKMGITGIVVGLIGLIVIKTIDAILDGTKSF